MSTALSICDVPECTGESYSGSKSQCQPIEYPERPDRQQPLLLHITAIQVHNKPFANSWLSYIYVPKEIARIWLSLMHTVLLKPLQPHWNSNHGVELRFAGQLISSQLYYKD